MGPDRIEEGRRRLAGLGESVGGRLGDGVRSLRDRTRDLIEGDDGPPDVPDPGLDPELDALDALGATEESRGTSVAVFERMNLDLAGGAPLWELFAKVDPGPTLPVAVSHTVGLGPLLLRFLDVTDPPALPERAVRRVLDLVTPIPGLRWLLRTIVDPPVGATPRSAPPPARPRSRPSHRRRPLLRVPQPDRSSPHGDPSRPESHSGPGLSRMSFEFGS